MAEATDGRFYDTVPLFDAFEGVADEANYRPLPDGWVLAVADIVNSTGAIADGRYKTVNMAGASVISALMNVLEEKTMPFVFGGDGALAALPASMAEKAHGALSAVKTWVAEELDLELRAALVPVSDIRANGLDMRVARFKASDEVSYAMFAGGGASWAEAAMKAGRYHVDAAAAGSRPDLTGLSCRWNPIQSRHGAIASIIAVPGEKGDGPEFQALIADIVALADEEERNGHPVPELGPNPRFSFKGIDAEVRAAAPRGRRVAARCWITLQTLVLFVCLKMGWNLGSFDTTRYRRDLADNTDFRKFDDGLKMTIDISAARLERIEQRLRQAAAEGVGHYGLHQQDSALMTCIVPTPMTRDHIHFVDGASGGYAVAASKLKASLARTEVARQAPGGDA
ncbi:MULTISPECIES: DUF3095 domain-containing protein [unclassified Ensifer]|uniref:DUF3095 domain-containing protein n=1 Tax=unclassified Ensifer TaxID=2633371 RepID=UPI0008133CA9|nr:MULTISPECIES: DUF3095 domain-containing protein [unclassified Ensifer]OCO99208.1 adenylate cyclase [Ensifer sp. LC11]OCO99415.1 adenylate cyclase [Ensifer sp. LC13]OCP12837.1 adenylate cyclase [Ensifer sp. LC14]OCP29547.1 adenylate cyclase [Ensifer sp. LC499]